MRYKNEHNVNLTKNNEKISKMKLYFAAILPDPKTIERVTALKQCMANKYSARHALKSPPHITLIPPFKWPAHDEPFLKENIDRFVVDQEPFHVRLSGFSAFPPRVIYVDIMANPTLEKLHQEINIYFTQFVFRHQESGSSKNDLRKFTPHMTIAFRDLTKKKFHAAWDEFKVKAFSSVFKVHEIALLRHNGKCWEIAYRSSFQQVSNE